MATAHKAALAEKGLWDPGACGTGPAPTAVIEMVTNYGGTEATDENPHDQLGAAPQHPRTTEST